MNKWVFRIILMAVLSGAGAYYYFMIYPEKLAIESYNMGIQSRDSGDLDGSIFHFEKAIKSKPDFSQAYNELAVSQHRKKNYDDAINAVKKAIELDPNNATAWYNLGTYYENKNMNKEAAESYRKFLVLNPNDPDAEELKSRLPSLESP